MIITVDIYATRQFLFESRLNPCNLATHVASAIKTKALKLFEIKWFHRQLPHSRAIVGQKIGFYADISVLAFRLSRFEPNLTSSYCDDSTNLIILRHIITLYIYVGIDIYMYVGKCC